MEHREGSTTSHPDPAIEDCELGSNVCVLYTYDVCNVVSAELIHSRDLGSALKPA